MDQAEIKQRLELIEGKLAFMDEAQLTVSDQVARQARELDVLGRALERLAVQLQQLADRHGAPASGEERPPHY